MIVDSLPIEFSKTEIDFGIGSNQFKVEQIYQDSLTLTLKEKKKIRNFKKRY